MPSSADAHSNDILTGTGHLQVQCVEFQLHNMVLKDMAACVLFMAAVCVISVTGITEEYFSG